MQSRENPSQEISHRKGDSIENFSDIIIIKGCNLMNRLCSITSLIHLLKDPWATVRVT